MVMKRLQQQGIFNENLRRSFEKLVADKRDLHEVKKGAPKRIGMLPKREGTIKFVNSSSESDLDSLSPDISTFKPFNRKYKTRLAIRRQTSSDSGNSTESNSFKFKHVVKKKEVDKNNENSAKDSMIFDLRKSVDSLNIRLNQNASENIRLKLENTDLKRREAMLSEERNELKNKLLFSKDTEINLGNLVSKLSNIVQSQDNEIAILNERKASTQMCRNCDNDQGKTYFVKRESLDQLDLLHRLKVAEVNLSEQVETNKQLKQYLEILLIQICDK